MPGTQAQGDWVQGVLGYRIRAAAKDPAPRAAPGAVRLLGVWSKAKDEVDVAIGKLHAAMRATGDVDLVMLAEHGMYVGMKGEAVRLMTALMKAEGAPTPQAMAALGVAIENFQDHLDGSILVDLIEDNPFGVSVPVRQTLGAALADLRRQVASPRQ